MLGSSKARLRAAILGESVDRVPVWLRGGLTVHQPLPGPADRAAGWRADPACLELWEYAREHCEEMIEWKPGLHFNRFLCVPPTCIREEAEWAGPQTRRVRGTVETPKGPVAFVGTPRVASDTFGRIRTSGAGREDLERLRSVPFEVAPVSYSTYERGLVLLQGRGVMCLSLPSPSAVVASCMPSDSFLSWSTSQKPQLHEVLKEVTSRVLACLEAVFARPLHTIASIAGSELCTPPSMAPDAYDEFVTPYDSQIVAFLKRRGVPTNCRCRGRLGRALHSMIAAGFGSTDPVEPPPAGDVSLADARRIVGERLTLIGGLGLDEIERASPEQIRDRVRAILDTGKGRLVLSAPPYPVHRISAQLTANYRALIDEAVSYGRTGAPPRSETQPAGST